MNINNYIFSYDSELKNKLLDEIIKTSKNKNTTFLLNFNKDKFTILEKYIFDLIKFYKIKNNNDENDENNENKINFIEFWCKEKTLNSDLHVDCDEYLHNYNIYNYPLKSLVTYFNNNDNPTIITNIDREKYLYKNFENESELIFSLPKENKVLIFDGNKYHGVNFINENEKNKKRIIIAINIWNIKPKKVNFYYNDIDNNYNKIDDIFTFLEDFKLDSIQVNNLINYDLFDNICYQSKNIYPLFLDYIHNNYSNYKFVKKNNNTDVLIKNKYGNLINDINFILNKNKNEKINRFYQRFKIEKIITPEIGKWIIEESEEYASNFGWTTQRHCLYPTTDIEVKNIKSVYRFFNILFNNKIKNIIIQSYNLNNDIDFDFNDIFIVKYNEKQQNFLEMHHDESFLSINILLNNENEFEGGGTLFDDGLIMKTNCGDLILHSSKIKHTGLQVYKGTRYILVAFINLKLIP